MHHLANCKRATHYNWTKLSILLETFKQNKWYADLQFIASIRHIRRINHYTNYFYCHYHYFYYYDYTEIEYSCSMEHTTNYNIILIWYLTKRNVTELDIYFICFDIRNGILGFFFKWSELSDIFRSKRIHWHHFFIKCGNILHK